MSQDHVLGTQDEVVVLAPWTAVGRIIGRGRKPGALLAPPLTSFVSGGDVGWLSSPQNSLFVALTTSGPVFGDNAFRKVMRVKWGRRVGLWSSVTGVLIRSGRDTSSAACTRRPSEDTVSRRLSESKDRSFWRNQPCWLLELGFPASRAVRNKPLSLVFCDGSPSRLIQESYKISPGLKFPICISDGVRNLFCYRVVGWQMT